MAASFVIEQTVLILQQLDPTEELDIIIERRGQKEDKRLDDHFQRICARGTGRISPEQLHILRTNFIFRNKKENINGLQLADLVAYPIARYVIEPGRANPAFDILAPKIYRRENEWEGLRIYP